MNFLFEIYNFSVAGVPLGRIGAGLLVVILSLLAKKLIITAFRKGKKSGRDGFVSELLSDIALPSGNLLLLVGIMAGFSVFGPGETIQIWFSRILNLAVTCCIIWLMFRTIDALVVHMAALASKTESKLDDQLIPILRKLAKVIITALGVVFYLQVLGYPVTGIIAGLGIGGIAIALAAQDSLSGIFASLTIFLDRPFMVGDFIQIGSVSGTVEEIGLRSTRIRTVGKTLVTVPNKEVVDCDVDNMSMRPMRRTEMTIGLTYNTTADQMESLLESIRKYLHENSDVDDQVIQVYFTTFADWSLNIDMKFFLRTTDYSEWLAMRERINLDIMRMVDSHDLSMAFPTSTIVVEKQ